MAINSAPYEAIIIDILTRAAGMLAEKARQYAPPHLQGFFVVGQVERNGSIFSVEVINTHKSAQFFEEGVEPHTIEAKNASVLRFEWETAPPEVQATQPQFPVVFFRKITHPGIPAYQYMEKAYNETIAEVDTMLEAAFSDLVIDDAESR